MLVIHNIKPSIRIKDLTKSLYTTEELAAYFKEATKRLMEDIAVIKQVEQESWRKIRNGEIS